MTVYVVGVCVEDGHALGIDICGIFRTKEKAEAFAANHRYKLLDIEEYELDKEA